MSYLLRRGMYVHVNPLLILERIIYINYIYLPLVFSVDYY